MIWPFKSRSGNVAMMYGLAGVPLLFGVGASIDFSVTASARAAVANAADAAVLAALSPMAVHDPVGVGETAFQAALAHVENVAAGTPTLTYTEVDGRRTATITYNAGARPIFGQLLGFASYDVSGRAEASFAAVRYIDIHFLVDVSASMGLASTAAGRDQLIYLSRNDLHGHANCAFACHVPETLGTIPETGGVVYASSYDRARAGRADPHGPDAQQPERGDHRIGGGGV